VADKSVIVQIQQAGTQVTGLELESVDAFVLDRIMRRLLTKN
jgi:hypothetical protein